MLFVKGITSSFDERREHSETLWGEDFKMLHHFKVQIERTFSKRWSSSFHFKSKREKAKGMVEIFGEKGCFTHLVLRV